MTGRDKTLVELRELGTRRAANEAEYAFLMKELGYAVVAAHRVGVTPTEIIKVCGLSRRTVYQILGSAGVLG